VKLLLLYIGLFVCVVAMLAVAVWSLRTGTFWEVFGQDCCSGIFGFGATIVVTIGGFLLWHSLLVAALVGGSIMAVMLPVLSIAAASSRSKPF